MNTAIENITPGVLPSINELVVLKPTTADWSNGIYNIAVGTATLESHALNKTAADLLYYSSSTALNAIEQPNNIVTMNGFEIINVGQAVDPDSATTLSQV